MGSGTPGGPSLDEAGRGRLHARWQLTDRHMTELTGAVAGEIEKAKVFLDIAAQH
jgi:hypothetical protein